MSSGPMCRSGNVSRGAKREEAGLRVARPRVRIGLHESNSPDRRLQPRAARSTMGRKVERRWLKSREESGSSKLIHNCSPSHFHQVKTNAYRPFTKDNILDGCKHDIYDLDVSWVAYG